MSYAWFMVAITFMTQFLAMGFVFYSAGIFLVPLQQEFDVGRTEISLIGTVMSIGGAIVAPFIGRWIGRGSIRNIMTLGCVAMGIGFLAGSRASELWQLFALFGSLVTFALATMGGVTTQALVVNWFKQDRTMALGISLMGVSASGAVLPAIAAALIESAGWRWAYEVIGWASLGLIPVVFFTVINRPEDREQGTTAISAQTLTTSAPEAQISTLEALRERNLWIIAITCGISFMVTSAIMVHIPPFAQDLGLSKTQAASMIAPIALGAAGAKILFGWIARKIGERQALQLALAMQAVGTLGLNFVSQIETIVALALVLGTGLGGVMPLGAALLARAFGPRVFGPMMGLMTPLMIPLQSIGAPLAGGVFDRTGSYRGAWFGFALAMLIAMAILAALRLADDENPELVDPASQQA